MATVAEMLRRMEAINLTAETEDAIQQNQVAIADLNREQLFKEGIDSTGKKLSKYKNEKYALKKNLMNPLPGLGNPDFYVTGAFQKSIYVSAHDNQVVFDADNSFDGDFGKAAALVERDGPAIFGLTPAHKVDARAIIHPTIITALKAKTGCK